MDPENIFKNYLNFQKRQIFALPVQESQEKKL